jgi:tetratricopeptide (TPR) repeat protein
VTKRQFYCIQAKTPDQMRDEAQSEALKHWTELNFSEASAVLETYLNRPTVGTKLQHIRILEDQQVYLYYASLLFSQGRIREAADNYRLLTEAAKTQMTRWLELMSRTQTEIKKSPMEAGKPDQREEYLQQLAGAMLELRGASSTHHHDYAKMLEFLGETIEAQRAYETALELYTPFKEREPALFGTLQAGLSMLYEHLGNYNIALPLHASSLRANPRTDRFDHPHVATMLHHIHTLQDTPEERKRLEQILDKGDRNWRQEAYAEPKTKEQILEEIVASGPSSQSPPALTLDSSSSQTLETKRADEASPIPDALPTEEFLEILTAEAKEEATMLRAMLKAQRPALGNIHMALLPGLLQLATMERRIRNFDDSMALLTEALDIVRTLKGESHCDYATVLMHKSIHHHAVDQLTEAEVTARQALSIKEELLGIDHLHVGIIQYDLATLLSKRNLHRESFEYFHSTLEVFKKHLFEDHPYTKLVATTIKRAEEVSYRQTLDDTHRKLGPFNPSM